MQITISSLKASRIVVEIVFEHITMKKYKLKNH